MKNISIILNAVLLIAVGVLYYLHFTSRNHGMVGTGDAVTVSDFKIAFINADSLVEQYEYLKASAEIMEAKKKRIEQDYRNRAENLQNEISAYQRNMNNMTIGQMRAVEEDLARKQQNLQLFEQNISQELMNDQARINRELYDRVTAFLKQYGKEKGIMVVLKFDPSSDVLYAYDSLDITKEVIGGLNKLYQQEKADKEKAAREAKK
jgi:outer membrane protein